ncbi:BPSS1780 family membrane protein [Chitinilyticum piscinae]|uniref:DUF7847 domain-containing protein n=1 Tax=Chitinilyticum piscinae TaxID=2866724 RepID=A0A8J7FEU3_9NEIS|nr:BPSS1780 family membrane protein [Chitinilyticum piscinae]MBE9608103.1 hypothetical protein [Chitinilyticum piscinae]
MTQQDPFHNPYASPMASLEQPYDNHADFLPDGRPASGGASDWIGSGWATFKEAPGMWVLLTLVYWVVLIVAAFIPFVGSFIQYLGMPVLLGGIYLGCQALDNGEELTINHLFAGFQDKFGQLVVVGAIYMGIMMLIGIVLVIVMLVGFGAAGLSGLFSGNDAAALSALAGMGGLVIVGAIILFPIIVLLTLVFYIAPALVVLHDQTGLDALKSTWRGCIQNLGKLVVFALLMLVIFVLAVIPCGLGLLVAAPVIFAAQYWMYRDIFVAD